MADISPVEPDTSTSSPNLTVEPKLYTAPEEEVTTPPPPPTAQEQDATPPPETEAPPPRKYARPDDPDLLKAYHLQENANNLPFGPVTKSGEKAKGPFQFMQATFDQYKDRPDADIQNYEDSSKAAQKYLTFLDHHYDGDPALTAAAYNAGEGVIDKYKARTQDGSWDQVSALMAKDNAYAETRAYVPSVLGKYEKLTNWNGDKTTNTPTQQTSQSNSNIIGTASDFKSKVQDLLKDTAFQTGSATDQLKSLSDIVNQNKWASDTAPVIKQAASALWDGASAEEKPNFPDIIGVPPITQPGNPTKAAADLEAWRYDAKDKLRQQGINPSLLGSQLDNYLDQSVKDETEGNAYRSGTHIFSRTVGALKEATGAALQAVTAGPAAGLVREVAGSTTFGRQVADNIDTYKDVIFGSATDNGFYARDPQTGRIQRNGDGTPQSSWGARVADGVGNVAGVVATAGLAETPFFGLKAATSGTTVLAGTNVLNSAGSLFKQTYDSTKDISKSYGASMFAIPSTALAFMGEMGTISGAFRPSLAAQTPYDLARFFAQSGAKNFATNLVAGAASNVAEQTGLNLATGKPFSGEEAAISGVTQGIGAAIPGLFFDYSSGNKEFVARTAARKAQQEAAAIEITDFRNSLDQTKEVPTDPKDIDNSLTDAHGITATPSAAGTILSKNFDIIQSSADATLENAPQIAQNVRNTITPDDLEDLAKQSAEISKIPIRDQTPEQRAQVHEIENILLKSQSGEYLYSGVQVHEKALDTLLKIDPGALGEEFPLIQYNKETKRWENSETGESANFAKDLLFPKASQSPQVDLSDISHINVIDHDALNTKPDPSVDLAPLHQSLTDIQTQKDVTTQNIKEAQGKLNEGVKTNASIDKENAKIGANSQDAQKQLPDLNDQLTNTKKQIDDVNKKITKPSTKAGDAQDTLKSKLQDQQATTLEAQARLNKYKQAGKNSPVWEAKVKVSKTAELELKAQIKRGAKGASDEASANKSNQDLIGQRESLLKAQGKLEKQIGDLSSLPIASAREKVNVDPLNETLTQHQSDLADYKAKEAEIKQSIKDKQKEIDSFNKDKAKAQKLSEKGLGAFTKEGDLYLGEGETPQAKQQIYAHEAVHAIQNNLDEALPSTVDDAVEQYLTAKKALAKANKTSAKEVADTVLLPGVKDSATIPDTPYNKLVPEAQDALLGKKEFMANQVAAVMLKRQGVDIGDYHIVPELEDALGNIKLPQVPDFSAPPTQAVEQPSPKAPVSENPPVSEQNQAPTANESKVVSEPPVEVPSKKASPKPTLEESPLISNREPASKFPKTPSGSSDNPFLIDAYTKETVPTARGKEYQENIPGFKPQERLVWSKTIGNAKADAIVKSQGLEETQKYLESDQAQKDSPESVTSIRQAFFREAVAQDIAHNTPETNSRRNQALQLVSQPAEASKAGLVLNLQDHYKDAKTAEELYAQVIKNMHQNGIEPSFTDYMLKEFLEKAKKYVNSNSAVIKNKLAGEIADITVKSGKEIEGQNRSGDTSWAKWTQEFYKTNLLSGLHTDVRVFAGHAFTGPIFTILSHPFQGGMLSLKTALDSASLLTSDINLIWKGGKNNKFWEGEGGENFINGLTNPKPFKLPLGLNKPGEWAAASARMYNYFGNSVAKGLATISNTMTTLSERAFLNSEKYTELKKLYGDDPTRFSNEVAKLRISPTDRANALEQAKQESINNKYALTPAELNVRAYEILDKARYTEADKLLASEYGDSVSLRGETANPLNRIVESVFNNPSWNKHPALAGIVQNYLFPFVRAMNRIHDVGTDFVPGLPFAEKAIGQLAYKTFGKQLESFTPYQRTQALKTRLKQAQIMGTLFTAGLFAGVRTGLIQITGDPENVLNKKTGGKGSGDATTNQKINEFKQLGTPEFSILVGGKGIRYEDIPGLGEIAYGIYKMNKALDNGEGVLSASAQFYYNAFHASLPFIGIGTLSTNTEKIWSALTSGDIEQTSTNLKSAVLGLSSGFVPGSGLLKDVQKTYEEGPQNTKADFWTKMFKDVPGLSQAVGSKPAVDRFGDPIQYTGLERTSFSSAFTEQKTSSDPVWQALNQKGLIVPEMQSAIKWNKTEFPNTNFQTQFVQSRAEDRLNKAFTDTLSPDEWYDFRKSTGPAVRAVAAQVAQSSLPHNEAQILLDNRVHAIEEQAKKRYILTGRF